MATSRMLIVCWLGLVALSVTSVQLGNAGGGLLLTAAVLLAALGKAWLIADGFMQLRHAPPLWRGLLLGWPLVVGGLVLLTLWLQLRMASAISVMMFDRRSCVVWAIGFALTASHFWQSPQK